MLPLRGAPACVLGSLVCVSGRALPRPLSVWCGPQLCPLTEGGAGRKGCPTSAFAETAGGRVLYRARLRGGLQTPVGGARTGSLEEDVDDRGWGHSYPTEAHTGLALNVATPSDILRNRKFGFFFSTHHSPISQMLIRERRAVGQKLSRPSGRTCARAPRSAPHYFLRTIRTSQSQCVTHTP